MHVLNQGSDTLRIGTRGSALALAQANLIREALASAGVAARLVTITTAGDQRAPDTAWGEGAFVTAIEAALLSDEVDIAVHSAKDVPTGSRMGTDSPRRTAFLRALRPDLLMHPLHGNVDTRLRKLDAGETDALVLAEAGLTRLG